MNSNELQKLADLKERVQEYSDDWFNRLDERERRLVNNCVVYSRNDPAGLPGHALMLIVAKLTKILNDEMFVEVDKVEGYGGP